MTKQLESLGVARVKGVTNPADALTIVRNAPLAVRMMYCDLQMPEIDGVQMVRHLAELGYRGGLVLISGEDVRILHATQELARMLGLHLLDALQKPITVAQLRNVLDHFAAEPFADTPKDRKPRRIYTPNQITEAIKADEIGVFVQPQVAFSTRQLTGVETLARWHHPKDGLVYPDQFIRVAEESGLMPLLTAAVLRKSLQIAAGWAAMGLTPKISVNISMENLVTTGLAEQVEAMLSETGVPPSQLTLEVTESRMIQNRAAALDVLTRLRLKRIGLSIDDFGTGHSSLAQLRDLPFTELKIDQGFVHGAMLDSARGSICAASMMLARELGLVVVAEGVEDQNDWDYARAAGCDVAQGYFIARPMPPADLPSWLSKWKGQA